MDRIDSINAIPPSTSGRFRRSSAESLNNSTFPEPSSAIPSHAPSADPDQHMFAPFDSQHLRHGAIQTHNLSASSVSVIYGHSNQPPALPPRAQSASLPMSNAHGQPSQNPQGIMKRLQHIRLQLSGVNHAEKVGGLIGLKELVEREHHAATLACASGILQPAVELVLADEQLLRVLALRALSAVAASGSQEVCMGLAVAGLLSTLEHLLVPPFQQPEQLDYAMQAVEILSHLARHHHLCGSITCTGPIDKILELLDRNLSGKLVVKCCAFLQLVVASQEWVADDLVTRCGLLSRMSNLLEPTGLDPTMRDAALELVRAAAVYPSIEEKVRQAVSLPLTTLHQLASDVHLVAYIIHKFSDLKFDWDPNGPIPPSPRGTPLSLPTSPPPVPNSQPTKPASDLPGAGVQPDHDDGAANDIPADLSQRSISSLNATTSSPTAPVDPQLRQSISCAFTTSSSATNLPMPAGQSSAYMSPPASHAESAAAEDVDALSTSMHQLNVHDSSAPPYTNSAAAQMPVLASSVSEESFDSRQQQDQPASNPFIAAKTNSPAGQWSVGAGQMTALQVQHEQHDMFQQPFESPSFRDYLPRSHSSSSEHNQAKEAQHASRFASLPERVLTHSSSALNSVAEEDVDEMKKLHTLLSELPSPPSSVSSVSHSAHTSSSSPHTVAQSTRIAEDVLTASRLHTPLLDSLSLSTRTTAKPPVPRSTLSPEQPPSIVSASHTKLGGIEQPSHPDAMDTKEFVTVASLSHLLRSSSRSTNSADVAPHHPSQEPSSTGPSSQTALVQVTTDVASLSSSLLHQHHTSPSASSGLPPTQIAYGRSGSDASSLSSYSSLAADCEKSAARRLSRESADAPSVTPHEPSSLHPHTTDNTTAQRSPAQRHITSQEQYMNDRTAVLGNHTNGLNPTPIKGSLGAEPLSRSLNASRTDMRESIKGIAMADRESRGPQAGEQVSTSQELKRRSGDLGSDSAAAARKENMSVIDTTLSQILPYNDPHMARSWATGDAPDRQILTDESRSEVRPVIIVGDSLSQYPSHPSYRHGPEKVLVLGQAPPVGEHEDSLPVCYGQQPKVLTAAETVRMVAAKHHQALQDQYNKAFSTPPLQRVSQPQVPTPKTKPRKGFFGLGMSRKSLQSQSNNPSPPSSVAPSHPSTSSTTSMASNSTGHGNTPAPHPPSSGHNVLLGARHAVMDNEGGNVTDEMRGDGRGPSLPYSPISTGGSNSSANSGGTTSSSRTKYRAQDTGSSKKDTFRKMLKNAVVFSSEF